MTAEIIYHTISQFATKTIKIIISNSKIFYTSHKNYYLKSIINSENHKDYYLKR